MPAKLNRRPRVNTKFRVFRFDCRIWEQFHQGCDSQLSDPRAILQALMLEWVNAEDAWPRNRHRHYAEWQKQHS